MIAKNMLVGGLILLALGVLVWFFGAVLSGSEGAAWFSIGAMQLGLVLGLLGLHAMAVRQPG